MRDNERSFLNNIEKAIDSKDSNTIQDAVSEFSEFCFKNSPDVIYADTYLSDDFIDRLILIMENQEFIGMDKSHYLFAFFQNDWGRLTEAQRIKILEFLGGAYNKIKDTTSSLIISEIFGDYLGGERGLTHLINSLSTNNEVSRAHIAHGLKLLALNSNKESIRSKAVKVLSGMSRDRSSLVKYEANKNLKEIISSESRDH